MKKVLVVGSGGREHALGWKLAQSPHVGTVYYAPGNGGTEEGLGVNVDIDSTKPDNFPALFDFVRLNNVDLTVVGPEVPLSNGLVDYFYSKGNRRIFGPTRNASVLEGDKFYSHNLMDRLKVPQAYGICCSFDDNPIQAIANVSSSSKNGGVVIKARGLTGGKGVSVCDNYDEAVAEIKRHADVYGPEFLISERLEGEEFSFFGISDGMRVVPWEVSFQDHKRLLDGDKGPNTGGMGAYGPTDFVNRSNVADLASKVLNPIIKGMRKEENEFKGFIYAGIMMTKEGPKVLEYNCRFGDPEAQPAMMLLKSDLYDVLDAAVSGDLSKTQLQFNTGSACCVVLASQGYPEKYEKGKVITGLEEAGLMDDVKVFHAGTKKGEDGRIYTNGGRVLGVTGYSPAGIRKAVENAYNAVARMGGNSQGFAFRKDIAEKGLAKICW
ncbi:MAG: phosphoribosylamine--glycine ligase [Nanoarchaeota archaeon]